MALLKGQLERWQQTGWERGGWHAAKDPRPGLEPRVAGAKTKPLYLGCLIYQLSKTPHQERSMLIQLLITFFHKNKMLIYMHEPVYGDKHCHWATSPFLHLKLLIGLYTMTDTYLCLKFRGICCQHTVLWQWSFWDCNNLYLNFLMAFNQNAILKLLIERKNKNNQNETEAYHLCSSTKYVLVMYVFLRGRPSKYLAVASK